MKKEYEKLGKYDIYQRLKEYLEKVWKMKAKVVQVIIVALGTVAPKLEKWFQ